MALSATLPTSRRLYLSQSELAQFANITINDADEADDVISQAEELIDSYVGYVDKFMRHTIRGSVAVGGAGSFTMETDHQNTWHKNYLKWCLVEIIDGTGEGQRRTISGSTYAGVVTLQNSFDTALDTTSVYQITQLGKFPRKKDVTFDGDVTPNVYYKSIPDAVRRAVASQVEYIIEMGDAYFETDKAIKGGESIGDYSYRNMDGQSGLHNLIAPKAKLLLRGIRSRVGKIVV